MPTATVVTANTGWTQIGTGLTACILHTYGPHRISIGTVAPLAGVTAGLPIGAGETISLPNLAALGGGVWVRASDNLADGCSYAAA